LNPHDRVTDEAVKDLAVSVDDLAGKTETLKDLVLHDKHVIHRLIGAVAVLALLIAGATAGFALWNTRQDASHLAVQRENTEFRDGVCREIGDWRTYLAETPPGNPARQAAASRIEAGFRSLCKP